MMMVVVDVSPQLLKPMRNNEQDVFVVNEEQSDCEVEQSNDVVNDAQDLSLFAEV